MRWSISRGRLYLMLVCGAGTLETHKLNIKERGLVTLPKRSSPHQGRPAAQLLLLLSKPVITLWSTFRQTQKSATWYLPFFHPPELYPEPRKITTWLSVMRKQEHKRTMLHFLYLKMWEKKGNTVFIIVDVSKEVTKIFTVALLVTL